jgi:hypothetical protein
LKGVFHRNWEEVSREAPDMLSLEYLDVRFWRNRTTLEEDRRLTFRIVTLQSFNYSWEVFFILLREEE